MTRHGFLALVTLLGWSVALAGDLAEVTRVRFSADGTRVAALSRGVHDGSGYDYAELTILSTTNGRPLFHRKLESGQGSGYMERNVLDRTLWSRNTAILKQFGIPLGGGQDSKPRYRSTLPETAPLRPLGPAAGETQRYDIALWSKSVPFLLKVNIGQKRCSSTAPLPEAAFSLSVGNQVIATQQKACSMGYGIERVDVKGNRVLITMSAFTPGFEGPNLELFYLAATLR